MKIALIACVKKKNNHNCKAKEMYISTLFKYCYKYASKRVDKIYILSAKYGLLNEETVIYPYNETLKSKSEYDKKVWSYRVIKELAKVADIENDSFLILAGLEYRKYIIQKIKKYEIPLKGLSLYNQVKYLKEHL